MSPELSRQFVDLAHRTIEAADRIPCTPEEHGEGVSILIDLLVDWYNGDGGDVAPDAGEVGGARDE